MSNRRVGVVTGAGRGMGYAAAQAIAGSVDALVLVDLDEELLAAARAGLADAAPEITTVVADVTDRERLDLVARSVGELGSLRSVVHAAGISPAMADWRRVFEVDLVGSAHLLDALLPLVEPGTAAVCFASSASRLVAPDGDPAIDAAIDDPCSPELLDRLERAAGESIKNSAIAYGWAKRGVQRLVEREAIRWGTQGGRVCSVSPGVIDTVMGALEVQAQEAVPILVAMSPVARLGRSEEVAAAVAFLLSDQASFITGADLLVDGGMCVAVERA